MTIKTICYRVLATCLVSATAAAAQQAPLITVHKDDKPPYVSPFDKPSSPPQTDAAAMPKGASRATQAQVALPAPTANTTSLDNGVEEAPKKYRGTARQRYRQKMADLKRMREEEAAQLAATQGLAGQPAPGIAHTPAITTPIAAPTVQPLPMASARPAQQAQQYATPGMVSAPGVAVAGAVAVAGGAISQNTAQAAPTNSPLTVPADIGDMTAANSNVVTPPAKTTAPPSTTMPPAPKVQPATPAVDWLSAVSAWFTPMVQALMGGIAVLLLIVGYVIKKTLFKTDPAFTDPWFKPAK